MPANDDDQSHFSDRDETTKPVTAASVNPYASPREASRGDSAPVGLWRDGRFVVAHRHSPFPPICLRTNEPARRAFRCRLTWSYRIDFFSRYVVFDVGLCEACIQRHRRVRLIGWLLILTVVGSLLLIGQLPGGFTQRLFPLMLLIDFVLFLSGWVLASRPGVRLKVKRVHGPYFWLKGAHSGFVERLPPWLGG